MYKKLLNKCVNNEIKWVLFDFFGTLVFRSCSDKEIKAKWGNTLSRELKYSISGEELTRLRLASETMLARESKSGEIRFKDVCGEVYRRACLLHKNTIDLSKDEFYGLAYRIECDSEKNAQTLRPGIEDTLSQLVNMGKKIAVVSDFYLDEPAIRGFLDDKGIGKYMSHVFISADEDCSKARVKLYNRVLEKIEAKPSECVMVGDTKRSDIENAKKSGIDACYLESIPQYETEKIEKELKSIYKDEYKGQNRYSNYCFSLYLATERLYKEAVSRDIKKLYFLSREGEFMKKLFDIYSKNRGGNIESAYLYVSRKSTFPSTLLPLEEERFDGIKKFSNMSVRTFLTNLGFEEEAIEEIATLTFVTLDEEIKEFFKSQVFNSLLTDVLFKRLYDENLQKHKSLFYRYLDEQGVYDQDVFAIVDVGWKATMQDNLRKITGKKCVGFYVGIDAGARSCTESEKVGLLFSRDILPTDNIDVWSFDKVFFERILWATHPSTDSYAEKDGKIAPVFKEYSYEAKSTELLLPLQPLIEKKFVEIDKVLYGSCCDAEALYTKFLKYHLGAMLKVNRAQLKLQRITYANQAKNFGTLNSSQKDFNNTFSKKKIVAKFLKRLGVLKNTELIVRILLNNKMYFLSSVLYKMKYRSLKRQIKKK